MQYNTPILLLIFNRLSTVQRVLGQLRKVKPTQLFIVADGPRKDKPGEKEKCETVREWLLKAIDWNCEVKTLFRENNVGCGKGVSEGISWFFDQVEDGIILEDDILVDLSFFPFCSEMLEKYRNNERVMSISAANLMYDKMPVFDESYFFSNYGGNWGWASWRRSWRNFDFQIAGWNKKATRLHFIRKYGIKQYLFFKSIFDAVVNGTKADIWDYQWWFCILNNSGLTIIPSANLMQNIGFGSEATHTFDALNTDLDVPVGSLTFPLKHPQHPAISKEYEQKITTQYYSVAYSNWQKIKILLKIFFN